MTGRWRARLTQNWMKRRRTQSTLPTPVAQVRFAPVGLAGVVVALAQKKGLEALLGPLQVVDGVRAGPGQVADRLVDGIRHVDRRQFPGSQ